MDIFIGYTRDAEHLGRRLRTDLVAAGFSVWSADEDLRPGANWSAEITSAIQGSKNVIVIVSLQASNSPELTSEIALAAAAQAVNRDRRLIPILFDSSAQLPFFLKRFQSLDMSNETKYREGLARLLEVLREQPTSKSDPLSMEGEIELLRAGEEALKLEVMSWQQRQKFKTMTLWVELTGLLSSVAVAVVFAFALEGVGLFRGVLSHPVFTLVLGAVVGYFSPRAVVKLTEASEAIFGTKEQD